MTESMTCGEARRLLWPDEGPRRATDDVVRAQAHADGCDACRAFLDDMRSLARRVGEAAPRPEAPREVRDRLFEAVARVRTMAPAAPAWRRHWRWGLAAGAAFAASLLVGLLVVRRPAPDGAMAIFAEDHLRAVSREGIATSDSLTAARWLAARLPMAVEIPLFPGATLTGARLSLMGDDRGAVLEYDLGGRMLSYFVVPAHGPARPRDGLPELSYGSRMGYRVVAWQQAGLTHALVANLPDARLADLARYCMHQMIAVAGGVAEI